MMYEELIKSLRKEAEDTYHFLPKILCLQAADAIEKLQKENLRLHAFNDANLEAREMLHERIKELTDTNVGKWIPVSERLPEQNTRVIGFMAWKGITAIEYQNGNWYSIDHLQPLPNEAVTHWMPLPEPPKEEKDG